MPFAAGANWSCVNGESQHSISHRSRVFYAKRKVEVSPLYWISVARRRSGSGKLNKLPSECRAIATIDPIGNAAVQFSQCGRSF
jgi:hypothetical protein